jgi:hypothetical protein
MSEQPICDPATLGLSLLPMPSPEFSIASEGSASGGSDAPYCVVDIDEMTVTITDVNGELLPIDRNGETFALDRQASSGFVWGNWCGEAGPFTITVKIAGQTLTLEVANGPECTRADQPSTIWGTNDRTVQNP